VIQARKLQMFGKIFVDQAGSVEHGLTPVEYEGGGQISFISRRLRVDAYEITELEDSAANRSRF
jgi:hypothetical protein